MSIFDQPKKPVLHAHPDAALSLSAAPVASNHPLMDEVRDALSNVHDIKNTQVIGDASALRYSALLTFVDNSNNDKAANEPENINSVEIHGDGDFARHSAKLVGKNLVSAAALASEYKTAHGLMTALKPGLDDLVHTDRISFYDNRHDYKAERGTDIPAATSVAEQPVAMLNVNQHVLGDTIQCSVVAPSPGNPHLEKEVADFYKKISTDNDPQSKVDAYKFVVHHEIGHCLENEMRDEGLSPYPQIAKLKEELDRQSAIHEPENVKAFMAKTKWINAETAKTVVQSSDRAEIELGIGSYTVLTNEMLGDSFAALKTQKDYYVSNKEDIINNRMPAIAPVIEKVASFRADNTGFDPLHDTSSAINRIVEQLKKPGQLDALERAGDDELLITAYHVVDMSHEDAMSIAGLKQKVDELINEDDRDNYQLNGYLNSGIKPIFELGIKKKKTDEEENEQNTLYRPAQ